MCFRLLDYFILESVLLGGVLILLIVLTHHPASQHCVFFIEIFEQSIINFLSKLKFTCDFFLQKKKMKFTLA